MIFPRGNTLTANIRGAVIAAQISRRGVAATELAILLPLLIVLCLAAVDIGRFGYVALAMDNAVRVGAQRGATRSVTSYTLSDWQADIIQWATNELGDVPTGWMNNLQIGVTYTTLSDSLNRLDVSANANFSTIVQWPFISTPINIHREIIMDQYR